MPRAAASVRGRPKPSARLGIKRPWLRPRSSATAPSSSPFNSRTGPPGGSASSRAKVSAFSQPAGEFLPGVQQQGVVLARLDRAQGDEEGPRQVQAGRQPRRIGRGQARADGGGDHRQGTALAQPALPVPHRLGAGLRYGQHKVGAGQHRGEAVAKQRALALTGIFGMIQRDGVVDHDRARQRRQGGHHPPVPVGMAKVQIGRIRAQPARDIGAEAPGRAAIAAQRHAPQPPDRPQPQRVTAQQAVPRAGARQVGQIARQPAQQRRPGGGRQQQLAARDAAQQQVVAGLQMGQPFGLDPVDPGGGAAPQPGQEPRDVQQDRRISGHNRRSGASARHRPPSAAWSNAPGSTPGPRRPFRCPRPA